MTRAIGLVALLVLVGLTALLALAGCGTAVAPSAPPPTLAQPSTAPAPVPVAAVAAPPVRVRIPAIGVDSSVVDLGVDAAGVLVPPDSADVTGWFAAGPAPGAAGPALLAGHVDSKVGPGVFFRLSDLRSGNLIEVQRADGSTVRFAVTRSVQAPKVAFPTELVYAPVPGPELRLITCGGSFDRSVGHYRDNIVVEAVSADDAGWTIR
jgi:Sortase domain